jgi:Fe-S-cluster containining protein
MESPPGLDLATRQRERAVTAAQRAGAKLKDLRPNDAASALIAASQRARSLEQRVIWLQRAASAWARPLEDVGACRSGCAHCCHIAVTISRVEAARLARASGRSLNMPTHPVRLDALETEADVINAQETLQQLPTPSPCPFLVRKTCSVYEHRPIACRVLVNLDDDDLLCRHAPTYSAEVPYADARAIKALALSAQASSEFADIRDFFPA